MTNEKEKPILFKTDEPIEMGIGVRPIVLIIGVIGWAIAIGVFMADLMGEFI